MMTGVLRIKGTIDLEQFWPGGESDADTTKIKVKVGSKSFSFAPDGKNFKVTSAFVGAFVRGASKAAVIRKDRITVRLQGIDAPELHYRAGPIPRKNKQVSDKKRETFNGLNKVQRRQYWGETATVALANKLSAFGAGSIQCQMYSLVDHPHEVIDTYGRFVGNICVGSKFHTDINLWLAEQGWVYPTYYSSMSTDEIAALDAAGKKGKAKKRTWKDYSTAVGKFDKKLVYRPHGAVDEANDKGPVLMPKLFRRQVAYRMQKAARIAVGTFAEFLSKSPDYCFRTDEFVEQSVHTAQPHMLHQFIKGTQFTLQPQELVFKEKFSTLVDGKGKVVEDF
jgi:endonuclease YncB( thermonuclease family)